jgi:hypothetical protein
VSETLTPELESRRPAAGGMRAPGRRFRLGALLAIAVALGFVLWLRLDRSSAVQPAATADDGAPVAISVVGLHTLAEAVPSMIFWLGPMDGVTYELTHTSGDRVFVRYLPSGVAVGSNSPYLTVATYPFPDAYAATLRASRQPGAVVVPAETGAIAFYDRSRPQSVFFSEQGASFQVEVFDPSGATARALVGSGRVQPVVETTAGGATAIGADGLRSLAAGLGHPLYWVGERPGTRFELTRTPTGKVFVRYLPAGVPIGAAHPYLTIATYPFPNALAALRRVARTSGGQAFDLPDGGLAVVDAQYPKSIHVAYPGSPYQVEVFDPSPARARALVTGDAVQAIG